MNCLTRASRGSVNSTLIENSPTFFRQICFYLAKCIYSSNLANFSSASGNPELVKVTVFLTVDSLNYVVTLQTEHKYACSQEVRGQLKFLEELDRLEKKKHEEQEREVLLRAVKVSKHLKYRKNHRFIKV